MEREIFADENIGAVINEYGEIIRNGGEEIQFSVPIFTPPAEEKRQDEVEVSFRVMNEFQNAPTSTQKSVSSVSKLELEKMREEFGM